MRIRKGKVMEKDVEELEREREREYREGARIREWGLEKKWRMRDEAR